MSMQRGAAAPNRKARPTPIRTGGLHARVIQDLGKRIITGEFPAGAPLPGQDECCALLGVSRSVLREALRVMAAKGLIEARPKAGTFVRPREAWNFADRDILEWRLQSSECDKVVDELYDVRQMIEPAAAFAAASKAKLHHFRKIGEAYDEMAAAGDGEDSIGPDLEFHRAIIAASGNDLLSALGQVIEAALTVSFRFGIANPHGQQHSLKMHKTILDAIVERDAAAARLAMQQLIEYSKRTVLLVRSNRGKQARPGRRPTDRRRRSV